MLYNDLGSYRKKKIELKKNMKQILWNRNYRKKNEILKKYETKFDSYEKDKKGKK